MTKIKYYSIGNYILNSTMNGAENIPDNAECFLTVSSAYYE